MPLPDAADPHENGPPQQVRRPGVGPSPIQEGLATPHPEDHPQPASRAEQQGSVVLQGSGNRGELGVDRAAQVGDLRSVVLARTPEEPSSQEPDGLHGHGRDPQALVVHLAAHKMSRLLVARARHLMPSQLRLGLGVDVVLVLHVALHVRDEGQLAQGRAEQHSQQTVQLTQEHAVQTWSEFRPFRSRWGPRDSPQHQAQDRHDHLLAGLARRPAALDPLAIVHQPLLLGNRAVEHREELGQGRVEASLAGAGF